MDITQQALVDRIVKEEGKEAIPKLVKLLETSEECEVLSIIREALSRFGSTAKPYLLTYIGSFSEETGSLPGLLVAIEILGEIGTKGDIPMLFSLLGRFEHESDQLYVYEAIARLGGGEELLSLLEFFLFEDEEREQFRTHIVMILSTIYHFHAIEILIKLYTASDIREEEKELSELSMINLLSHNPEWFPLLKENEEGRKIIEKLSKQQISNL
jgi:hypothetical protein